MAKDKKNGKKREVVSFDYIKSNSFRVVHGNGVLGGVTPSGDIHMAVWNQRQPYPKRVSYAVTSDQELGDEVGLEVRDGLVREVEVGVVMSPSTALEVIEWLQKQLESHTDLRHSLPEEDP